MRGLATAASLTLVAVAGHAAESGAPRLELPMTVQCTNTAADTPMLQNAIDTAAGRPINLLPGTCQITATLTKTTRADVQGLRLRGAGMGGTVFDNRVARAPMLVLDGGGSSAFQHGGELSDFRIVTTTSPAGSHGIEIRGLWQTTIQRVWIQGLTGDGIRLVSRRGDPDSPAYTRIAGCRLQEMKGYGFKADNTAPGFSTISFLDFEQTHVVKNAAGGVLFTGIAARIHHSAFAQNGGDGGIYLKVTGATASSVQQITIAHNEFQSNSSQHIKVDSGLGIRIASNHFNSEDVGDGQGYRPATSVLFGDGVTARLEGGAFVSNIVRNTPAGHAHTAFDIKRNARYTTIHDTVWQSFSVPAVRFADAGTFTTVRDDGEVWKVNHKVHNAGGAGASYTPDLRNGMHHRVVIQNSPFTLHAPTQGVENGQTFTIDLYNQSGGALTVNFNPVYAHGGFFAPGHLLRVTGTFRYSATDAKWLLVGAWSAAY